MDVSKSTHSQIFTSTSFHDHFAHYFNLFFLFCFPYFDNTVILSYSLLFYLLSASLLHSFAGFISPAQLSLSLSPTLFKQSLHFYYFDHLFDSSSHSSQISRWPLRVDCGVKQRHERGWQPASHFLFTFLFCSFFSLLFSFSFLTFSFQVFLVASYRLPILLPLDSPDNSTTLAPSFYFSQPSPFFAQYGPCVCPAIPPTTPCILSRPSVHRLTAGDDISVHFSL